VFGVGFDGHGRDEHFIVKRVGRELEEELVLLRGEFAGLLDEGELAVETLVGLGEELEDFGVALGKGPFCHDWLSSNK
jgi:hypothetical protein